MPKAKEFYDDDVEVSSDDDAYGDEDEDEMESEADEDEQEAAEDGEALTAEAAHHANVVVPTRDEEQAVLAGELSPENAVLQLETEALLTELRVKHSQLSALDGALQKLQKLLRSIPEQKVTADAAAKFISLLDLPPERATLDFAPPTRLALVGSHPLGLMTRPHLTIDLALELPAACLGTRPTVNHRYHARRALYLSAVAAALARSKSFRTFRVAALRGDTRRPVLEVSLGALPGSKAGAAAAQVWVRIIPCVALKDLPLAKLGPDRNNVRAEAVPQPAGGAANGAGKGAGEGGEPPAKKAKTGGAQGGKQQQEGGQGVKLVATADYNASVLEDALVLDYHSYLQAVLGGHPAAGDAILLLKIWARRQGLAGQPGGVSGGLAAMLVAWMVANGRLMAAMTPFHVFRAALQLVASSSLTKGMALPPKPLPGLPAPPTMAALRKQHPVVFQDFTGYLNLTSGMSKSCLAQLQQAAKRCVAALQSPPDPLLAFRAAFPEPAPPGQKTTASATAFDYLWRIQLPAAPQKFLSNRAPLRQQERKVEEVVTTALGSRARLVRVLPTPVATCKSLEAWPAPPALPYILVGAQVDATQAGRLVDVGPAADDAKAAARFRSFWGARSELRRFQDGKISESVVWEADAGQRHIVPDMVVEYAVQRHLGEEAEVVGTAVALDGALAEKGSDEGEGVLAGRSAEASLDRLSKQLRNLSDLALKVVGVQPLGAATRHTCAFYPLPHPLAGGSVRGLDASSSIPRCVDPIEVMVQLQGSGKWSDNPVAYLKMRAALGVQLANALSAAYGLTAVCSEECVDVLLDGFAFRLRLHADREEIILAKRNPPPVGPTTVQRSQHHGLVAGVQGETPAFGAATRLAKRWVGGHLLGNHINEEAVELLAVAVFTHPSPHPAPGSRLSGFLRWLQLLASYPWSMRPLVVDPTKSVKRPELDEVQSTFDRSQEEGGPPMFIVTPHDLDKSLWTQQGPSAEALRRAVALAGESAARLEALMLGTAPASKWLPIMASPWTHFDLVITLRKEALPFPGRSLPLLPESRRITTAHSSGAAPPPHPDARAIVNAIPGKLVKAKGVKALQPELLVGFDPVALYVEQLQGRFGHLATFCADLQGGRQLGVKWRPAAFLPLEADEEAAHTSLCCSSTVQDAALQGRAVPHICQVLAEMQQMGEGLVEDIIPAAL